MKLNPLLRSPHPDDLTQRKAICIARLRKSDRTATSRNKMNLSADGIYRPYAVERMCFDFWLRPATQPLTDKVSRLPPRSITKSQ